MKLLLTLVSGSLAVWLGTSFVSPADPTEMSGLVVSPEHADSHRLGAVGDLQVELPGWQDGASTEVSPLLTSLAALD